MARFLIEEVEPKMGRASTRPQFQENHDSGRANLFGGDANASLTMGLRLTSTGFDLGSDDGESLADGRVGVSSGS